MDIQDIERMLFRFARLSPEVARTRFPELSSRMGDGGPGYGVIRSASQTARVTFDLLRDLREEHLVPELVEEARAVISLEPAHAAA